jgi:hypothetical protein
MIILMGLTTTIASAEKSTNTIIKDEKNFRLVIPVYNNAGLEQVRTTLKKYIRQEDTLLVVTGNFNKLDLDWANNTIKILRSEFPGTGIVAGAGGISNVKIIANGINEPIDGILYIYEPNLPNGAEFDWNFDATLSNYDEAAETIHSKGLRLIGKPTGRPIMQKNLQKHNWDYSKLGNVADYLFIQTQTYATKGASEYEDALDKLLKQYDAGGKTVNFIPQIAVDTNSRNGVSVDLAVECSQIAMNKGLEGMLVWWSPAQTHNMSEYMEQIGR